MNLKKIKTIDGAREICLVWGRRVDYLGRYAADESKDTAKRLKAAQMALFYFNRIHILTIRSMKSQLQAAIAGNIKAQFQSGGQHTPQNGIIDGGEKIIKPQKPKIITNLRDLQ